MDNIPIILNNDDPQEQFTFQDQIGEGAYGSVYKAVHKASQKLVAIKIVPSTGEIQSLQQEIQILKECKSDYVVKYHGSFFKDDTLWLVMEYCVAGSVIDLIKITKRQLLETEIAAILYHALKGIEYLHQNKKIHRDIKAGNILLDHRGQAKLADFGVSAQLLHTNADKETKIGTPFWMSPEVISKQKYNQLTDIWSLGITAIELAEGQPPLCHMHPVRAMFVIKSNPPQGLTNPLRWSSEFIDFVKQCLNINVNLRPTASQLLQHKFIIMGQNEVWRLRKLVEDSIQEIEHYRQTKGHRVQEFDSDNQPLTMISNNSKEGQDSIERSDVGTIIDIGTLVVKRDDEVPQRKDLKELDFVSYAKGIRMVEELAQKQQIDKPNEFDHYANGDDEDDEEENEPDDDNSEEVLEKMTIEEQERFKTYLQAKMDAEINKIKEKYLPKIQEIDQRISQMKPKPQDKPQVPIQPTIKPLLDKPKDEPQQQPPKRLEQNLQQIINLPFNFQVNQELLQRLSSIKLSQAEISQSSQLRSNPKPKSPFEFAPNLKR